MAILLPENTTQVKKNDVSRNPRRTFGRYQKKDALKQSGAAFPYSCGMQDLSPQAFSGLWRMVFHPVRNRNKAADAAKGGLIPMQIPVDEIQIKEGRRELNTEHVRELANSIRDLGLLNPITVDKDHTLIAGLHRLEAVKLLEWPNVECTVSSLEGLQAELAEIDENFVRNDLSALEFGDMLLRRKEIYEILHPETKNGGDRRSEKTRRPKGPSDFPKSFVEDSAEKLGMAPRTIRKKIQTAKNLTTEAKEAIKDTKITKLAALQLSRLEPQQQREAAALLAAKEIKSVDEYKAAKLVQPGQNTAEPKEIPPALVQREEPPPKQEEPAPVPVVPDTLQGKYNSSFRKDVADLKDSDKVCRCTPDSLLAEFTAFAQKCRRETEWYSNPHYAAVFPLLSPAQLDYLRQQTDSICSAATDLFHQIERNVQK